MLGEGYDEKNASHRPWLSNGLIRISIVSSAVCSIILLVLFTQQISVWNTFNTSRQIGFHSVNFSASERHSSQKVSENVLTVSIEHGDHHDIDGDELVNKCVTQLNAEFSLDKFSAIPSKDSSSALNPGRSARAAMQGHCARKFMHDTGGISLFTTAKLNQILFCENADFTHVHAHSQKDNPSTIQDEQIVEKSVTFGPSLNFQMFLMPPSNDIVSGDISRQSSWDAVTTYLILMLLHGHLDPAKYIEANDHPTPVDVDYSTSYAKKAQVVIQRDHISSPFLQKALIDYYGILEQPVTPEEKLRRSKRVFLDAGSNIGWFSLVSAAAGFSVYSFEPMKENEILFRKSICANEFQNQITYFNMGVSDKHQQCIMFSEGNNVGNGNVACSEDGSIRRSFKHYAPRNWIELIRLDSIVDFYIPVLKIDVEGFETFAFTGAQKLLHEKKIGVIFSEYSAMMLREKGSDPAAFIHILLNAGFEIRRILSGNIRTKIDARNAANFCEALTCDLFIVHKSLLNSNA